MCFWKSCLTVHITYLIPIFTHAHRVKFSQQGTDIVVLAPLQHKRQNTQTTIYAVLEWTYIFTVGKQKGAPFASKSAQLMLSIAGVCIYSSCLCFVSAYSSFFNVRLLSQISLQFPFSVYTVAWALRLCNSYFFHALTGCFGCFCNSCS